MPTHLDNRRDCHTLDSLTDNLPQPFDHSFNFDAATFQPTGQTWAPMDFDDLANFGNDDLPISAAASTTSSADTEKGTQEVTRSVRSPIPSHPAKMNMKLTWTPAPSSTEPRFATSFPRAQGQTPQRVGIPARDPQRKASGSHPVIYEAVRKCHQAPDSTSGTSG